MTSINKKVLKLEAALIERSKIKGNCVFTNGCFDLLHLGHIKYLEEAKALGDYLIVAINSDKSVKQIKGLERPIVDENQRMGIIAAMEVVDMVILFDEETPIHIIKSLKPDILVKGGDYNINQIVGAEFVTAHGGKVKQLSFYGAYSSSAIIDKIKKLCL